MSKKSYKSYSPKDLEDRKPVWIALSDLYLDIEMQDFQHTHIARAILESPYSLEEVKQIDIHEVCPVLKSNLRSVAGEWSGFKEDWLIETIAKGLEKRKGYTQVLTDFSYFFFKKMTAEDWDKIKAEHLKMKQ